MENPKLLKARQRSGRALFAFFETAQPRIRGFQRTLVEDDAAQSLPVVGAQVVAGRLGVSDGVEFGFEHGAVGVKLFVRAG